MKSAQIRSFFWPVFSYIQSEYRKVQTRENSVFGHFSRSENMIKSIANVDDGVDDDDDRNEDKVTKRRY